MKRVSVFLTFFLVGCENRESFDDIERFIEQAYAKAEVTSTPLPPEPNYESLAFTAMDLSDPFVIPSLVPKEVKARDDCWQPKGFNKKDPLEEYELSSMVFKGVIGEPGSYWALIEGPDSSIHRVGIGRILGSNKGRVDSISQKTLSITEHLSDGLGCWQVRNVRLALRNNFKGTQ